MVSYSAQPDFVLELVMPQHLPAHGVQPRVRDNDPRVLARTFISLKLYDARRETLLEFGSVLCWDFVDDFDVWEKAVRGGCLDVFRGSVWTRGKHVKDRTHQQATTSHASSRYP